MVSVPRVIYVYFVIRSLIANYVVNVIYVLIHRAAVGRSVSMGTVFKAMAMQWCQHIQENTLAIGSRCSHKINDQYRICSRNTDNIPVNNL